MYVYVCDGKCAYFGRQLESYFGRQSALFLARFVLIRSNIYNSSNVRVLYDKKWAYFGRQLNLILGADAQNKTRRPF